MMTLPPPSNALVAVSDALAFISLALWIALTVLTLEFSGISMDSSVEERDLTLDMQDSSGSQRYVMTRRKQDGSVFPEWRD
jgi:hypothetical protein